MHTQNEAKVDRINRFGITADLPLFNQEKDVPPFQRPAWLFNGNDIKAEIYHKMKNEFAENALTYLNAVLNLGGKATDHQVKEFLDDPERWPLHIVSARRNDLTKEPFYIITSYPGQTVKGPKGKNNVIWFVNYKNLFNLLLD